MSTPTQWERTRGWPRAAAIALGLGLATLGQPLRAQSLAVVAAGAPGANAGRLVAPRLAQAPRIDGALAPGEWEGALRVTGFTQLEPTAGAPMTERTEVWVARDDRTLYVAFVAYDADMTGVRTDLTRRDGFTASADAVGVAIDPYGTGSRGYHFLFSPSGVQTDGLGGGNPDFTWDGVLTSHASIESDRWIVEVAIPFATVLTGGHPREEWSLNFFRQIPRKGEEGWWVPVPRGGMRYLFEHMGRLAGMGAVGGGTRLELIPTASAQVRGGQPERETDASWGATLRVPVSPVVRAEATFRPDFSAVESDAAQVGFNERFALYYPEKRPFFLESADQFDTPSMSFVSDPIRLLHTRTFLRPRAGARLLATPGGGFIGGMLVQDERPDGSAGASAAVLRAKLERTGGVEAGLLATRLDDHALHNTVVGADANLRLPAATTLTLQLAASASDTSGATATARGTAVYADLARETGSGFQQVVYRRIDAAFDTRVGFVPRADFQQVVAHAGVYVRPHVGGLLNVQPMMQYILTLDASGHFSDVEYMPHVEANFTRQTRAWLGYRFGDESYRTRTYAQGRGELKLWTTPTPWVSLSGVARHGRRVRYDLDLASADLTFVAPFDELSGSTELRLGRQTSLSGTGTWRRLGGQGSIAPRAVWLGRMEGLFHVSATSYLRGIAQYDPDGRTRELSALAGLELNYGTQLHVGADYSSSDAITGGRSSRHSFFTRVSYLLRR